MLVIGIIFDVLGILFALYLLTGLITIKVHNMVIKNDQELLRYLMSADWAYDEDTNSLMSTNTQATIRIYRNYDMPFLGYHVVPTLGYIPSWYKSRYYIDRLWASYETVEPQVRKMQEMFKQKEEKKRTR